MNGKIAFFPEQASQIAAQIDHIYYALIIMTVVSTVVIFTLVCVFAYKYRRKPGNEVARPTPEHLWMELSWSALPLVVGLILFFWGAQLFVKIMSPAPANSIEIFTVGKRWMWKFQHPSGRREINSLHVPVGRPIKMTMVSQDVIHSFYVPAFRIKQDVVPGRYSTTWFEPTVPGTYHLFCTEYCGTNHSRMVGSVTVMEPSDYQAWLESPTVESAAGASPASVGGASGAALTPAAAGEALLKSLGCDACHRPDSAVIAPKHEGIYGRKQALADGSSVTVDDNYIRESILNPAAKVAAGYQPVMPSFQGRVSEEDIANIIAYIKSVGGSK